MTILIAYGTRPEALKVGPIVAELRHLGIEPFIVSSGQHTDLLRGSPAENDLIPDEDLAIPSTGDTRAWIQKAGMSFMALYYRVKPSLVVTQGDTMTALAASLAAKMTKTQLAHVEAGIRSGMLDEPYPEEAYRRRIGRWADYHFAPTALAKVNLLQESVPEERIYVTGNPIVSAIARYAPEVQPVEHSKPAILVTMHRREWLSQGDVHVSRTIRALTETVSEYSHITFIWPVHPHVEKVARVSERRIPYNLCRISPMPYRQTMETLAESLGVLTDSGGLQEEAATLGVPCAVIRNVSDRPESIGLGIAKLFAPNEYGMKEAVRSLVSREMERKPSAIYGTPDSACRIAMILQEIQASFGISSLARPAEQD